MQRIFTFLSYIVQISKYNFMLNANRQKAVDWCTILSVALRVQPCQNKKGGLGTDISEICRVPKEIMLYIVYYSTNVNTKSGVKRMLLATAAFCRIGRQVGNNLFEVVCMPSEFVSFKSFLIKIAKLGKCNMRVYCIDGREKLQLPNGE